jgi:flagellar motility protein MotE (MotC chaperone)
MNNKKQDLNVLKKRLERKAGMKRHEDYQSEIELPTLAEVEEVISKMKNDKAPGEDEIVADLF